MSGNEQDSRLVYINRLLAGCLSGGQLVWAIAILPTYRHLTPREFFRVHKLLVLYGDLLMPLLGLSTTVTGFLRYRRDGGRADLAGTAALVAAGITATVFNLPINNKLREWDHGLPPSSEPELLQMRDRWTLGHLVRTAGGIIALTSFLRRSGSGERQALGIGRPTRSRPFGWFDLAIGFILVPATIDIVKHVRWLLSAANNPEQFES